MTLLSPPLLTDRFSQALQLAHQLHRHQTRKGTAIPYISHLLSVAALVLEDGGDEDEAIAALLHDAVEDQGGTATLAQIQQQFGDRVAAIILDCTESPLSPKPPWQERKTHHLQTMRTASASARRVLLADKVHNARSLLADCQRWGDSHWDRFRGGKTGTLWYYQQALIALQNESDTTGSKATDNQVTDNLLWQELRRLVQLLHQTTLKND